MVNFKWCVGEGKVLLFPVVAPKNRRWGWGQEIAEAKILCLKFMQKFVVFVLKPSNLALFEHILILDGNLRERFCFPQCKELVECGVSQRIKYVQFYMSLSTALPLTLKIRSNFFVYLIFLIKKNIFNI